MKKKIEFGADVMVLSGRNAVKKKIEFSVDVVVSYPGHDPLYDRQIEKAARKSIAGSGFGLLDGRRDVVFSFRKRNTADNAVQRIRDMRPKKRGTRVKVYDLSCEPCR